MAVHPAKYTDTLIPLFAHILGGRKIVLDPFAGTGKIALIKNHGWSGMIVCNDIEGEWRSDAYSVDEWHIGDAACMSWAKDGEFDAICTSPTYGNRMADHHNARDKSRRITYRHSIGRELDPKNTGRMQWGEKYCQKHREIYGECKRVLRAGGLFVLNVSDHIRAGEVVPVAEWHKAALWEWGFRLQSDIPIDTPRMRFGANGEKRVNHERVFVFEKEA